MTAMRTAMPKVTWGRITECGPSATEESIRLWPMPDMTKPPLHTLTHDELMAKLDTLTNLRVVPDPTSATGWKVDVGPFPGWKEVPTW